MFLIESISFINLSHISTYYEILANQTTILLKNKESIKLLPFKYSNFHIIRLALDQIQTSLKSDNNSTIDLFNRNQSAPKSDEYIPKNNSNYKIYNYSHILSFNGILFYFFISVITYSSFENNNLFNQTIIVITMLAIVFIIYVPNMNYFIISDKYLIIKNSILFWRQTSFDLNQIKEIEIKTYFRKPGRDLIIKTTYFKTKTVTSTNLTNKQWKLFNEALKSHSIKIKGFGFPHDRKVFY